MFFWAVAGLLYAVALQRGDGVFARVVAATPPGPPLTAAPVRTLRLPDSSGTVVLTAGDVDWIEAQGNYCRVHAGARRPLVRRTLSSLLEELGPGFLRVHRSRAVNLERVQRVESRGGRVRLLLADGAAIEGGRAYQAEVRRRLGRSSPQA
jgi:two-component system LytT family response regulator